jgi:regulator of CtrA degradation
MHVIAWLLTQRAVDSGELSPREALDPARRLGDAPVTEAQVIDQMPPDARTLINASIDLHRRVARLDASQTEPQPADSPVQWMQARLAMAF